MNKIAAIMFVIGASIIAAAKMQLISINDPSMFISGIVIAGITLVFFSIIIVLGNSARWAEQEKQNEYKQKCDEFYDKHLCPGCANFLKQNNLVVKNQRN